MIPRDLDRPGKPKHPTVRVGDDAYIVPANETDFTGVFGEFDGTQRVDVGIDPY